MMEQAGSGSMHKSYSYWKSFKQKNVSIRNTKAAVDRALNMKRKNVKKTRANNKGRCLNKIIERLQKSSARNAHVLKGPSITGEVLHSPINNDNDSLDNILFWVLA